MNTETGELVPQDGETQGEIVLRGNAVMKGYYKDKAATDAALHDGWFSRAMPLFGIRRAISRSRTG